MSKPKLEHRPSLYGKLFGLHVIKKSKERAELLERKQTLMRKFDNINEFFDGKLELKDLEFFLKEKITEDSKKEVPAKVIVPLAKLGKMSKIDI